MDTSTFLLGSGAVLFVALLAIVYLLRRHASEIARRAQEHDKEMAKKNKTLKAKDTAIAEAVAEKDGIIAAKDDLIASKEAEHKAAIAAKDEAIASKDAEIAGKNTLI